MNIGIFGSCVSRDACEFMDEANVIIYVARHSVATLLSPHGEPGIDLHELESPFQRRMVAGDLNGQGLKLLVDKVSEIDVVLLDLVDERRGFWRCRDGTYVTNSQEIENLGFENYARANGAELIEFGTDDHFQIWKDGFEVLIDGLKDAGLWEKTILVDIDWASTIEGANPSIATHRIRLGQGARKLRRAARRVARRIEAGSPIVESLKQIRKVEETSAEQFAKRATHSNRLYSRYRKFARNKVPYSIFRRNRDLRIGSNHRWGPQPFHYRDEDYRSIVREIRDF